MNFKRISSRAVLAIAGALSPVMALAQTFNGESMLDNLSSTIIKYGKYLVHIAWAVIAVTTVVKVITAYLEGSKNGGQSSIKDAFSSLGIGLVVAIIILSVVEVIFMFS